MEIISMTCRNCGGKLQILKDTDQIMCINCGTEYLVSFNESGVSLRLFSEGIKKIQESTDKTAAELALARIKGEKENILEMMIIRVWDPMKYENLTIYSVTKAGSPTALHSLLEKELNDLEKSSFPFRASKSKIEKVKKYLAISSELLAKYQKLEEQESFYSEIINKK